MRLAFLLLALSASRSAAQDSLRAGAVVRIIPIEKYDIRRQGYVVSLVGDSVRVRFAPVPEWELRGEQLTLARARLEVRESSRRHARRGALIGMATLGVAGYWAGSNMKTTLCHSPYQNPGIRYCDTDASMVAPLTIAGAIAGAGLGAIGGWLVKSERWLPVAPQPAGGYPRTRPTP